MRTSNIHWTWVSPYFIVCVHCRISANLAEKTKVTSTESKLPATVKPGPPLLIWLNLDWFQHRKGKWFVLTGMVLSSAFGFTFTAHYISGTILEFTECLIALYTVIVSHMTLLLAKDLTLWSTAVWAGIGWYFPCYRICPKPENQLGVQSLTRVTPETHSEDMFTLAHHCINKQAMGSGHE